MLKILATSLFLIGSLQAMIAARTFNHPGMLHMLSDLERMKNMVAKGNEPWKSAWAKLQAQAIAKLDYKHNAVAVLNVQSGGAAGTGQQDDACAAHFQSIMWYVTGNEAQLRNVLTPPLFSVHCWS